jgi:transposase
MIRDDQVAWLKLAWREGLTHDDAAGLARVSVNIVQRYFDQFAANGLVRLRVKRYGRRFYRAVRI